MLRRKRWLHTDDAVLIGRGRSTYVIDTVVTLGAK